MRLRILVDKTLIKAVLLLAMLAFVAVGQDKTDLDRLEEKIATQLTARLSASHIVLRRGGYVIYVSAVVDIEGDTDARNLTTIEPETRRKSEIQESEKSSPDSFHRSNFSSAAALATKIKVSPTAGVCVAARDYVLPPIEDAWSLCDARGVDN